MTKLNNRIVGVIGFWTIDNESTVVNSIEAIVAHLKSHGITDNAAFVTLIRSTIIIIVTASH